MHRPTVAAVATPTALPARGWSLCRRRWRGSKSQPSRPIVRLPAMPAPLMTVFPLMLRLVDTLYKHASVLQCCSTSDWARCGLKNCIRLLCLSILCAVPQHANWSLASAFIHRETRYRHPAHSLRCNCPLVGSTFEPCWRHTSSSHLHTLALRERPASAPSALHPQTKGHTASSTWMHCVPTHLHCREAHCR